jgi:trans-aconitate methyltransferase
MYRCEEPMPNEFSEIAKRYRETSLVQQSAAEILFRLLAIGDSEDVLDVGCGTGNLTKKIRVATSGRVVGIDPAEGMIARAAREHGDGIDFAVLSAETMSFHEEFDTIFCNSAFQWVRNPDKAVAGFAGALRAGGRVGIQAPARSDYCPNFLSAIEAVAADPSLGPTFAHFKSPWCFFQDASEYSALFVRHGFQVRFAEIQTVDSTHTPSQVFDIFASGAIAGYLDPSCHGCPIDERYMTGFRQTVREQFERQAGADGLVCLVFRRIFLVAVRA